MLRGKKILLGITGSIAAYKTTNLVRLFVKAGAEVKVVMTADAKNFVSSHTLSVLSKNNVEHLFFDQNETWNNHVKLGMWADAFLIAPATANTIAKMAHGICDNLLLACYLSARCKVYVAPAMDVDMYLHPTTKTNLDLISSFGNHIIPVDKGELASGLVGEGRMAEPEQIVQFFEKEFAVLGKLSGKKIMITAGPTYEAIDPVRFIGNRSSGKMGIALADEYARAGGDVTLILGPTHQRPAESSVKLIKVESADEMYNAALEIFPKVHIAVLSAAVADFKPSKKHQEKIKKGSELLNIELQKTKDILFDMGKLKSKKQCLVGFALETENLLENAKEKLSKKNLDFIVANTTRDFGAAFGTDTNKITIVDKHNNIHNFELKHKIEVARDIVNFTMQFIK